MCYSDISADLLAVGSSHEVFRLNLQLGKFQESYETDLSSINCIVANRYLQKVVCVGGNEGFELLDVVSGQRLA